jgi:hypothetical protein
VVLAHDLLARHNGALSRDGHFLCAVDEPTRQWNIGLLEHLDPALEEGHGSLDNEVVRRGTGLGEQTTHVDVEGVVFAYRQVLELASREHNVLTCQ